MKHELERQQKKVKLNYLWKYTQTESEAEKGTKNRRHFLNIKMMRRCSRSKKNGKNFFFQLAPLHYDYSRSPGLSPHFAKHFFILPWKREVEKISCVSFWGEIRMLKYRRKVTGVSFWGWQAWQRKLRQRLWKLLFKFVLSPKAKTAIKCERIHKKSWQKFFFIHCRGKWNLKRGRRKEKLGKCEKDIRGKS